MPPLSEHLFWDVDKEQVDPEIHAAWLTRRVLEYGRWRDWQALVAHFGKTRLREIVTGLPCLEPRSFAFCRAWFQISATEFRCFALTQSQAI